MKKILLICALGIASCQDDGKYVPDSIPVWEHERQDYTFSYGVKDLNTGDVKNQWEKKIGDTIHGHYTVLEADGSVRIVDYTADEKNGFNAVVKHEGPSYHPVIISTSHQEVKPVAQTEKPKTEPKEPPPKLPEAQAGGVPAEKPEVEDTQSVRIDPETEPEAIDAYLFIPTGQQNDFIAHYEYLADQQAEKFHQVAAKINDKPITTTTAYDFLKPVTINFAHYQPSNHEQHQAVFIEPVLENDFKPMKKTKYSLPLNIPNTFTTNKRPATTPGLKTYASENYGQAPKQNRPQYLRGPVQFPKRVDKNLGGQTSQLHPKKNYVSYTKHVAYFPDDY